VTKLFQLATQRANPNLPPREPSLDQKLYDKAIGEYGFSIFRADREQQDVGSIILVNQRMMGWISEI
jgi:hypothetical protein